jgi:hypothetical protein
LTVRAVGRHRRRAGACGKPGKRSGVVGERFDVAGTGLRVIRDIDARDSVALGHLDLRGKVFGIDDLLVGGLTTSGSSSKRSSGFRRAPTSPDGTRIWSLIFRRP